MIGTTDSISPRTPPTDCSKENCSATAAARPRPDASVMAPRYQLVPGVEHGAVPLRLGDHPVHADPPAGLDAGDLPAAEPDHVEAPAAVVQLRLQCRDAGPWPQRHRPLGAAHRRR